MGRNVQTAPEEQIQLDARLDHDAEREPRPRRPRERVYRDAWIRIQIVGKR